MRLLVADDLTGCCDSGIQFGACTVALSPASLDLPLPETDLLAINTASRLLPPEQATRIINSVAKRLTTQPEFIFKKIDSTLRGNPGAEIDACLAAFDLRCAFVAPACPEQGRTVETGILKVNGVPLHKTSFANDPATPVRESAIKALLTAQGCARIIEIPLLPDREALTSSVKDALSRGGRYLIFDAQTQPQLELIAEVSLALPEHPLLTGSSGLAKALAHILGASPPHQRLRAQKTLFICGSGNSAAHAQIQVLADAGIPLLRLPQDLNAGTLADIVNQALAALAHSSLVIAAPLERIASPEAITAALAQIALTILRACADFSLCLTGGETAFAILSRMAAFMDLQSELAPGIVAATIADGPWAGIIAITKAGGFGAPETLLQATQTLQEIL